MATYDFKKLGDVEALESVPENANALVEVGGDIKRVPGSNLGGGGVPTAILVLDTDEASGVSVASLKEGRSSAIYTATCSNMTFAEVKELMLAGKPVGVILTGLLFTGSYDSAVASLAAVVLYECVRGKAADIESERISISIDNQGYFYWYSDDHITTYGSYTPAT